ncbi:MAG TPA: efflux RND transporter periplasmic adaptor subunit [Thermoanaerobaculia bacterium]|nr:efflux RND transporter periplasmic adaptor subunit [Thermoanaerobaculia bacterium]HUM29265.1 efflux RND transporter periplasmic adaptor subunit [Thermoanaerobaculia bacterium]HXK67777.1 efflux RND transporter periplasmic adaptor subunit [Thermoanaerobaculia bacterium]
MKKVLIILAVVAVIALMIFFSVKGKGSKGKEVYTEDAALRPIAREVLASGEIRPRTYVNLQSDVVGKIIRLHFKEGDWVKKGQILVDIEKETLLRQRDQMTAAVNSAKANRERVAAMADEAHLRYKRTRELMDEKIVSQESLDSAWASLRQAEASLTAAEQDMERSQFALDELNEQIKKCTILAPMNGRVVELDMEEGEVVVAGMNIPGSVIGVVADMSDILAEVDVIESEIAGLKTGMPATIVVDALPDITFEGEVEEIAHSAFKKLDVNYFKVKVLLHNPDENLRPGMSARATITLEKKEDVLSVPIQAVVERKDEKVVFTPDNGKAKKLLVTTGISDEHHIEITEGLEEGTSVITGPSRILKDLKEGTEIKIKTKEEKEEDQSTEENKEEGADVEVKVD